MRYLVIGGAGFLGSRVCAQLLRDGDDVVAYDVASESYLRGILGEEAAQRIMVRGDMTDGLHLLRTAKEQRVDAIVHVASLRTAASSANPGQAVRVNCEGMVNVLETARILGIRRVAWASSGGVFGGYRHDRPIANDAPYRPYNVYSGTKVLKEVLAEEYARVHGLETIGIRFTLLVGPAQYHGLSSTVYRELVEKPVKGLPGRMPFGDESLNWLWIEDAARSLVLAARVDATPSRVFNIDGDVRPLREAAEIVRRLVPGADITLEPGVGGFYRAMDTSAIEQELGFHIQWRLEDQLRALVEHARSNLAGQVTARTN